MKDIPMFTSEFGVASLFLREIPYRKRAHIKIRSASDPEKLIEECIHFCRACGAEWMDCAGHPFLEKFPLLATLVKMQCDKSVIPPSGACLFPVTEETMQQWLDIYNQYMENVPNSAYMDNEDGKELLKAGDGYFVHENGELLGIGKASNDFIHAVVAVRPGKGETVVRALTEVLNGDVLSLMVAQQNTRAVRLYERMGFVAVQELSRWYQIFGK